MNGVIELNWNRDFVYPGMIKLEVPADGSCFFHSIAMSVLPSYQLGSVNNFNVFDFINNFRKELGHRLKHNYDKLSRGSLKEMSQNDDSLSLSNMVSDLANGGAVDHRYNELISDTLNIDIYILDDNTQDVIYLLDPQVLHKKRTSIVLLYSSWGGNIGHYELIGIRNVDIIRTNFRWDDPFILKIRKRIESKMNK